MRPRERGEQIERVREAEPMFARWGRPVDLNHPNPAAPKGDVEYTLSLPGLDFDRMHINMNSAPCAT